jgi:hypothetical protein
MNGDGKKDIVGVTVHTFVVALANGDGTFHSLAPQTYPGVLDLMTGDFNSDGHLDLVTSPLQVAFGRGDGTFDPFASYSGASLFLVGVLDVNGDKVDDVVSHDDNTGSVYVALGGAGSLRALPPQPNICGSGPRGECGLQRVGVKGADFNEDGFQDFVLADTTTFTVVYGGGDGKLRRGDPQPANAPIRDQDIIPADLDGDGHMDFVVQQEDSLWTRRGRGDGTFEDAIEVAFGPYVRNGGGNYIGAHNFVVADLDGDGLTDLAMNADSDRLVAIRRGVRGGSFEGPTFHLVAASPSHLVGTLPAPATRGEDLVLQTNGGAFDALVSPTGCP